VVVAKPGVKNSISKKQEAINTSSNPTIEIRNPMGKSKTQKENSKFK